jgi:hypothetical protein
MFRPAKVVRGVITECTGEGGIAYEDDKDWCLGWLPVSNANCTTAKEYEFVSSSKLKSISVSAGVNTYGGGGYKLELRGYIDDLQARMKLLQLNKWVDNRYIHDYYSI